jgi:uridine phosphorylase
MIESSELIITSRGSIYHLDVKPEEIANTIITVGDPARVSEVSKYFDSIEFKLHHREFVTHTGFIGDKRVSCVSTGIGTDNIDIVLTELDALVNIDFATREIKPKHTPLSIIRIGTSGSLQNDIPVDSIVASESVFGMDNLMMYYKIDNDNKELLDQFKHQILHHPLFNAYQFNADEKLINDFTEGMNKGITVTCSGFYGPQGRKLRGNLRDHDLIDNLTKFSYQSPITKKNYRITNFEMETSGIYGMSRMLGHKALSLSAIVANRVSKQFSTDANKVIDNLIQMVLSRI